MADYQKMYSILLNGITDCLEEMRLLTKKLIYLQKETEEIYLEASDAIIIAPEKPETDK